MASGKRDPAAPSRRESLALIGAALAAAAPIAPAMATTRPRVVTITLQSMAFGVVPADLRVGDAIEWVNADIFRHSATAKDGSFDVDLAPKARGRIILRRAGAVVFYCRYHPGMTGRLTVGAARGR